ncbi:MAG: histidinol-phosphatase [Candidatus Niameybacter stercoravium]|nr:histidinol-phosphatase [Candidatus Niameybacter stercoravium]
MIDFHTHILPAIDDGSRSLEESIDIFKQQHKAGVQAIVATPHFYPDDKLDEFLMRRDLAAEQFEQALRDEGLMNKIGLKKGAEVLLSVDTCKMENLEALCITGTKYILLEMPYSKWSEWVYTSVQNIIDNHKLIPIIAHVERYDTVMEDPNQLLRFIEMGALLQMNTYSLQKKSSKYKLVHKLLKHRMIHILGSDVHRARGLMTVGEGYRLIEMQHGTQMVENMQQIGECIYTGETVTCIESTPLKKRFGIWF